ncbi:MAG: ABC transporter permease [Planctomycetota bacterium]
MTRLTVTTERNNAVIVCRFTGSLTREHIEALKSVSHPEAPGEELHISLEKVDEFDSFGVISLLEIVARYKDRIRLLKPSEELKTFMMKVPLTGLFIEKSRTAGPFVEGLGAWLIQAGEGIRRFIALFLEFAYWVGVAPFVGRQIYTARTIRELYLIGVQAIPIVGLISFLMGVILALNAAYQLDQFGAKIFVANLVAVSMTRELGPVLAAVIVAGRTGSAIAAELGTMIVTEEIDALRVTGIHPTSFLIVPKLIALIAAMPCLVIFADVVSIAGGWVISVSVLDLQWYQYFDQTRLALVESDVLIGLLKSSVFGLIVGLTGATFGTRLKGGAEEVGRITTAAVVTSFFLIIVADMIFTLFFTLIDA